jgi:glutathione synthase/RimK-type ligase-like ATP-grasp enzyme
LELHGVRVINGYQAYVYETSKALQLSLLQHLGIKYPKSKVVNHVSQIENALEGLRFPIVIKANIGGSGAGIEKFNSLEEVQNSISSNAIDFGIDILHWYRNLSPHRVDLFHALKLLAAR